MVPATVVFTCRVIKITVIIVGKVEQRATARTIKHKAALVRCPVVKDDIEVSVSALRPPRIRFGGKRAIRRRC